MKSGKKVLSLLLVLCMFIASVPAVFAADETTYEITTPKGITSDPTVAVAEAIVNLTVNEGFELAEDGLKATYVAEPVAPAEEGEVVEIELVKSTTGYSFVMPAAAVTVNAEFTKRPDPSEEAKITSFAVEDAIAKIDEAKGTIVLTVRVGTDVKELTPVIVISEDATINTDSAETDFTEAVEYIVTAEDGKTTKKYTATIAFRLTPVETGADEILETVKHDKYMSGYGAAADNKFGINNNMTRAEAVAVFYNLLLDQKLGTDEKAVEFKDVPATGSIWYRDALSKISAMGIVEGYKDGTFAPNGTITRAEFLSMVSKFITLKDVTSDETFPDVPADAWYKAQMKKAMGATLFAGDDKGNFRPSDKITRGEVVAVVNKMLDRSADKEFITANAKDLTEFADLDNKHWAYNAVVDATNSREFTKTIGGEKWTSLTNDKDVEPAK